MTFESKAKHIRMILSDVDGVLTDGTLHYDCSGNIGKGFSTLDGFGISTWLQSGLMFGIVTGRDDACVACRAKDLHIDIYYAGIKDKRAAVEKIAKDSGLSLKQIAFIGDDVPDLPAMEICGLSFAPSDAADVATEAADYVTDREGGRGAVREVIDYLLFLKNSRQ